MNMMKTLMTLILLIFSVGVSQAQSPSDIGKCEQTMTRQDVLGQIKGYSTHEVQTHNMNQFRRMVKWYNETLNTQQKFPEHLVDSGDILYTIQLSHPLFSRGRVISPGNYFAVLRFTNGCIFFWTIHKDIMEAWEKYEQEATNG